MNVLNSFRRQSAVQFVAIVTIFSLLASAFPAAFFVAKAQENPGQGNQDGDKKVNICHWNGSGFELLNVSVNSIGTAHGSAGQNDGDIIPVLDSVTSPYPGQNLTTTYGAQTGAEVLANNCVVTPAAPDQCPNIAGSQAQVPAGYVKDVAGNCIKDVAPACENGPNLLANPSFEEPVADAQIHAGGLWEIFASVLGWTISSDGLELWNGLFGGASEGKQNAELDGNQPTNISQTVTTVPGATYELRFDFSPRPGTNAATNGITAKADDQIVVTATGDGGSLTNTSWQTYTNTFVAADASTTIMFMDNGAADSLGSLIDKTALCLVSLPPKPTTEINVYENTSPAENQVGWMFNRDPRTATAHEFNTTEAALDDGALYAGPITNTNFNSIPANDPNRDKFIAEYFWLGAIAGLESFSFDYKIGSGGTAASANQFYLNVYANFAQSSSTKFYDCRYDVVATVGSTGNFTTVSFDPAASYPVTTRGGASASPFTCPSVPADMDTVGGPGSVIRAFAINMGDTSATDTGLDAYFDKVVLDETTLTTTFDFEPMPTSAVTLCKYDTAEVPNGLPGWQLMLLKEQVESFAVAANTLLGYNTTAILDDEKSYVAIASGTWNNNRSPLNIVDAEYSTEDTWVTVMDGFTGYSQDILELQINQAFGANSVWGSYNSLHRYAQGFSPTTDGPSNFRIFDGNGTTPEAGWYGDNTGSLAVDLFEGYLGTTKETGCVTFENVPYGTYQVDEIMQDGFKNVSGLTKVVVDGPTETFKVVNEKIVAPRCELAITSSEATVLDTYGYAVETYDAHPNWTAAIEGATWVWSDAYVVDAGVEETHVFTETFTVSTTSSALLDIAADNTYRVYVNGDLVLDRMTPTLYDNNFALHTQKNDVDIAPYLNNGENELRIEVKNLAQPGGNQFSNPAGVLFRLEVVGESGCGVTTEAEPIPTYLIEGNKFEFIPATEVSVPKAGWTIFASNGSTTLSTTTDATGYYYFNVPAGEWEISEAMVSGWEQAWVEQNDDSFTPDPDEVLTCDFEVGGPLMLPKTLSFSQQALLPAEDESMSDVCTFYNRQIEDEEPEDPYTRRVEGYKYVVSGESNTPLAGWIIMAYNGSSTLSTTTDETGRYYFDLLEGEWEIGEAMPADWTQLSVRQNGESVETEASLEVCTFAVEEMVYKRPGANEEFPYEEVGYECDFYNQAPIIDETPNDGGSNRGGTRVNRNTPSGQVLGASTQCSMYLFDYMREGIENKSWEVTKLQLFLNIVQGNSLMVNGVFDDATDTAVRAFQMKYQSEVLTPWFEAGYVPHQNPTGWVYQLTRWKINNIVCPGSEPLPTLVP